MTGHTVVSVLIHLLVASTALGGLPKELPESRTVDPARTELRLARSTDGLHFVDLDRVLAQRASGPDLICLPNGDQYTIFDYAPSRRAEDGKSDAPPTLLACTRSRDHGRTWSPVRLLRLRGPSGGALTGRHGDLVEIAAGRFRLYFVTNLTDADRPHRATATATVLTAVTRNGLDYRVDGWTGLDLAAAAVAPGEERPANRRFGPHPMGLRIADRVHLYAAEVPGAEPEDGEAVRAIRHVVSSNGRSFSEGPRTRPTPMPFIGSLVLSDDGIRAYVGTSDGIGSLRSGDGRTWNVERGLRLAKGWDPAVARLQDGSFLMVYCTEAPTRDSSAARRALAALPDKRELARYQQFAAAGQVTAVDIVDPGEEATEMSGDADLPSDAGQRETALADVASNGFVDFPDLWDDEALAADTLDTTADQADRGLLPASADGFAPRPDGERYVDYWEWYEQQYLAACGDNAYDAYAEFMPSWDGPASAGAPWPELHNLFSDSGYHGPPGPWGSAEHPEWEASNQAAREVLDMYRDAGRRENYALRPQYAPERMFETPDGEPLLLEMLLPHLKPHRDLAKATLADAWRTEDGEVSSDKMLDAWEDTLRNANHVGSGPTLIEHLVGTSERALVQENARWALAHGVFEEHELEDALDVLMEHDRDDVDPVRFLHGEHAAVMQVTQYLFDDRQPDAPNAELVKLMGDLISDGSADEQHLDEIAAMTPADADRAVDAFDDYYHEMADQWRVGYPEVRAPDLDATVERYRHTNALTEILLPSLTRVQQIRTRNEASRRATQLSYATHLFKARHGRWPASLDELPDESGPDLRTDPFSGTSFGYGLTPDGFTIYSASENGLDDGGIHAPRWGDDLDGADGSDDFVFWPPEPRP
ncbi:MAG: hypothetical protein GY778_26055 [bacterium]|nr:hypothetical protein [bacterium]